MNKVVVLLVGIVLASCGGSDVNELHNKAKQHLSTKDYRAAVIEYKNILNESPNDLSARMALGNLYLIFGEGQNAVKEFRRAKAIDPNQTEVYSALAKALLMTGAYEEVVKDDELLAKIVNPGLQHYLKGEALYGMHDLENAAYHFDKAVNEHRYDNGRLGLARIEISKGRTGQAQSLLEGLSDENALRIKAFLLMRQKKFAKAEEILKEIIELTPRLVTRKNVQSYIDLINALIFQNRSSDAEVYIGQLEKSLNKHPVVPYFRGILAYKSNDMSSARQSFEQAIAIDPGHSQSLLMLGLLSYGEKNLEKADMYLSQYVSTGEENSEARRVLGATKIRLNRPKEAIRVLEPLLGNVDTDASIMALIGEARIKAGESSAGIKMLEKVDAQDPKQQEYIKFLISQAHLQQGNVNAAINELKTAASDSDSFTIKAALALSYLQKGDLKSALAEAKKLAEREEYKSRATHLMGVMFERAGDVKRALASYTQAYQLDNKLVVSQFALARLLQKQKAINPAKDVYRQILANNENNTLALVELGSLELVSGNEKQGVDLLEKSIVKDSKLLRPYLVLASYFNTRKDWVEAEKYLHKAKESHPMSPALMIIEAASKADQQQLAQAETILNGLKRDFDKFNNALKLQTAMLYGKLDKQDQTKTLLTAIVQQTPDFLPAYQELIKLAVADKDMKQALAYATQIHKNNDKSPLGKMLSGDIFAGFEKWADAESAYLQAHKITPNALALKKLVEVRRKLGKEGRAYSDLRKWLNQHKRDTGIRFYLAELYQADKKFAEAEKEYSKILAYDEKNAFVLNNLAWVQHEQKKSLAIETAKKASVLRPADPLVLDTYGWILVNSNKVSEGLDALQKAHDLMPSQAEIKYHLAVALVKSGDVQAAKTKLIELMDSSGSLNKTDIKGLLETL